MSVNWYMIWTYVGGAISFAVAIIYIEANKNGYISVCHLIETLFKE